MEFSMKNYKLAAISLAASGFFIGVAQAAPVLPSVAGPGWTTDRYEPASWSNVGTYQGRSNVLGIGIDESTNAANRGGQSGGFYNTQGRQIAVTGGVGDSISASLFLDQGWANSQSGFVRTDLWGRAGLVGSEVGVTYPITGFTNNGTGGARFRVYDSDTSNGWVDLVSDLTSLWGTWVNFEISALAGGYEYRINNSLVYTDSTIGSAGGGFTNAILQAYNFNDPALGISGNPAYTAYWSDTARNQVPEPGTAALVGLSLLMLGGITRMKRKSSEVSLAA
jgi:hypothetical protein